MSFILERKSFLYRMFIFSGLFVLLVFTGCTTITPPSAPPKRPGQSPERPKPYRVNGIWYQPIPNAKGFKQKGIASWYGSDFHGKTTSNGEVYDMHAMTAAHKTLPLGTYVRVDNLENGKQIDVRINDRGPFVRGRIIDLSYKAAQELGIAEQGTAEVKIEALGIAETTLAGDGTSPAYIPIDYDSGVFTFQVGAFKDWNNAERLRQKLDQQYNHAHITTFNNGQETFYRVRVGRYDSLEKITKDEPLMLENGFKEVIIIAE